MNDADRGEEMLEEGDEERANRTRGIRKRGRGRREREEQGEQGPQEEQAPQAEQAPVSDDDQQTETPQAQQAERAEQVEQVTVSNLEPVTGRRHDTFYLGDDVASELEQIYRRVSLRLLEETGVDLDDQRVGGRNRYFRPLALLLGARQLQQMSSDELRKTIESEELIDDLPETRD